MSRCSLEGQPCSASSWAVTWIRSTVFPLGPVILNEQRAGFDDHRAWVPASQAATGCRSRATSCSQDHLAITTRACQILAGALDFPLVEGVIPNEVGVPPPLASFSRADLEAAGFHGWRTWDELRASDFSSVPSRPGAYIVLRPSGGVPDFVHPSPAGWFKGKDPSVSQERLQAEWVDGAHVVYVGKADFRKRREEVEALRMRLGELGAFGMAEPVAHWGGRLIWQLADAGELLVAWHEVTWAETARDYEKRLLARFAEIHHGRRPFANLTG